MIVTCVHVKVKPENVTDFIAAISANHAGSIVEAGNLRFDVLQSTEDPTAFMIYEVFESEEAIQAHRETEHYKKWRDAVGAWMAEPRRGVKYRIIQPTDRKYWLK